MSGNGQPVLAKLDLPTGGAAMKPPPTTDKSTGLPASSLRVESTPSGLPFTVISMNSETERLQADLEDARTELADRKTEYAIKGLPAERNKYLKTRIGELEETTKRLESVVGNLPRVLSRLGSTPSALDSLPPGTYRVTVKQEGWPDQKQLVQVSASGGNVARAEFRGGSLKVTSEPRGATVSMDGKAVGTTPLELSSVIPGMKTLKVAKQGYSHKTLFANVQMGEPAIMSATLAKMNFDGTWRGSISGTSHNGNTDSPIAKSDHILRISGGGTHVTWTAIAPNGNDIVFVYTDCHRNSGNFDWRSTQ